MSRKHHKIDPLAAMTAANPASPTGLAAELGEADLERALAKAVALGRTPSQPVPAGDRAAVDWASGSGAGRRRITLAAGLAAVAVLAALLLFGSPLGGSGGSRPEFAAAAVRVAEANPRLLVTAPGWKILRADEFETDLGELTFGDGVHRLDLHWYPANLYRSVRRDRADVSKPEYGSLLGRRTATVEYSPREYATMLPPQGNLFIELRGNLGSRRAYDETLRSLRAVDVETWLEAMPPSTVRPEGRPEAIDEMLNGIPLPPGFDATALKAENSIANQSTLAVKVGNAVACGWVESWIAARAGGDQVGAERAVTAIASSPDWPIVRDAKALPWFSNYEVITKQMRAGRLDWGYSGYETREDGRTFGFGPAWKLTLGCDGTYRREVDGVPDLTGH